MGAKFGVGPGLIPDFLALVGDSADGYPGIAGMGPVTAARLLNRYGSVEALPDAVLEDSREDALLFKRLATLRTDVELFQDTAELRWSGPTESFSEWVEHLGQPGLLERSREARARLEDLTDRAARGDRAQ